ncbi:hypothetical protein DUI87_16526 [Hirundo rustica rustica]|uniref:Uncharacterized protein n=1 Tax=Hirundo rustica rustica TaxID=333673 RepID=A0A3M0K7P2_HIRRU|nr:hypothetical protein DUI87_16526 [Hirundo rustica rustica]
MAVDTLFSEDHIDMCHSEVTMQACLLISEIVFREQSATGDLGVTSHKRQSTNFREGPVRIRDHVENSIHFYGLEYENQDLTFYGTAEDNYRLLSAQYLQPVQSPAELEPAGAVTFAKWSRVASLGVSSSRAASPTQNPRKGELQAVVAATSHGNTLPQEHTLSAIVPLSYTCHCASMTRGPLGVPALVLGPVLGRKGIWSLNVLLGLQDDYGIPVEE